MNWDEGLDYPPMPQGEDMTLVIALRCADGSLIATDSKASDTNDIQSQRTKCFHYGRLLIGYCGEAGTHVETFLRDHREPLSQKGARDASLYLSAKLNDNKAAYSGAYCLADDTGVLAGVRRSSDFWHYEYNPEPPFRDAGWIHASRWFLESFWDASFSVDDGAALAAFCILESSRHLQAVGGPVVIVTTRPDWDQRCTERAIQRGGVFREALAKKAHSVLRGIP